MGFDGYVIAKVHDLDEGTHIGYIVVKNGTKKLEDTNLWGVDEADELRDHVAEVNNRYLLSKHWPDANDPEVVDLINDPEFEPINTTTEQGIDTDKLFEMVQEGTIRTDEDEVTGELIVVEEDLPKVPSKTVEIAEDPSAPMERIRKAVETVAKRRAEAAR